MSDPVLEAKKRIAELQREVSSLEGEVHILEGRVKNLNTRSASEISNQNTDLRKRVPRLEQALLALLLNRHRAVDLLEMEIETEALRKSLIAYCKEAQIEPELWKSIEY